MSEQIEEQKGGVSIGVVIALIIVIVGLGGLSGFFYTKITELESAVSTQKVNLEENETEISDLTGDLEDKIAEYNDLKGQYEELGLSYEELDAQIASLQEQVTKYKNANWSNKEAARKARKELALVLAQHQIDLAAKDDEITRYKLMADSLATSVDSLLVEQGVAVEKIHDLESKVEIASILKAENVSVIAINAKGKEDTDGEFKAKNVNQVKASFNFADNKVAKHEVKAVIFRLVQPDKSVVFDLASGGGSFTDAEGKTDFYTSKKDVKFDNSKAPIEFYYGTPEGEVLAKGDYSVEVYANGHKVGETTFIVK